MPEGTVNGPAGRLGPFRPGAAPDRAPHRRDDRAAGDGRDGGALHRTADGVARAGSDDGPRAARRDLGRRPPGGRLARGAGACEAGQRGARGASGAGGRGAPPGNRRPTGSPAPAAAPAHLAAASVPARWSTGTRREPVRRSAEEAIARIASRPASGSRRPGPTPGCEPRGRSRGDHRATGEEHQCPADRPVTDRGQHDPDCDPSGKEQVVEALVVGERSHDLGLSSDAMPNRRYTLGRMNHRLSSTKNQAWRGLPRGRRRSRRCACPHCGRRTVSSRHMQYAESILDLVGDTPLVRLTRIPVATSARSTASR